MPPSCSPPGARPAPSSATPSRRSGRWRRSTARRTARAYRDEIGGEGPHRYVLMCLVALEDSGLTVLPTHRLVRGLDSARQEALAAAMRRDFEIEEIEPEALPPPNGNGPLQLGYID